MITAMDAVAVVVVEGIDQGVMRTTTHVVGGFFEGNPSYCSHGYYY